MIRQCCAHLVCSRCQLLQTYIGQPKPTPFGVVKTVARVCGHKALGIVPHVAGALLATGVILWVTLRILMRYSEQPALRASALTLLGVTFVQVFLGIAAYMSRLATADAVQPMPVMVGFTVLHVAAGALTMAASVVLAIQVFRNVRWAEAGTQHAGFAVTS